MIKHSTDDKSFDVMSEIVGRMLRSMMQEAADREICPHCIMRYLAAMSMVQVFQQDKAMNDALTQMVIGHEVYEAAATLAGLMNASPENVRQEVFKPRPRH